MRGGTRRRRSTHISRQARLVARAAGLGVRHAARPRKHLPRLVPRAVVRVVRRGRLPQAALLSEEEAKHGGAAGGAPVRRGFERVQWVVGDDHGVAAVQRSRVQLRLAVHHSLVAVRGVVQRAGDGPCRDEEAGVAERRRAVAVPGYGVVARARVGQRRAGGGVPGGLGGVPGEALGAGGGVGGGGADGRLEGDEAVDGLQCLLARGDGAGAEVEAQDGGRRGRGGGGAGSCVNVEAERGKGRHGPGAAAERLRERVEQPRGERVHHPRAVARRQVARQQLRVPLLQRGVPDLQLDERRQVRRRHSRKREVPPVLRGDEVRHLRDGLEARRRRDERERAERADEVAVDAVVRRLARHRLQRHQRSLLRVVGELRWDRRVGFEGVRRGEERRDVAGGAQGGGLDGGHEGGAVGLARRHSGGDERRGAGRRRPREGAARGGGRRHNHARGHRRRVEEQREARREGQGLQAAPGVERARDDGLHGRHEGVVEHWLEDGDEGAGAGHGAAGVLREGGGRLCGA